MAGKDNGLPTQIVIFGASGDLTQRKLIPSLFNLYCKKRLPEKYRIVGFGSTAFKDETFRKHLLYEMKEFSEAEYTSEEWDEFASHIGYVKGAYSQQEFEKLNCSLE